MKIAAVVVTYNRKDLLKECLERLLKLEPQVPDVMVIDNGSTDGTKDLIYSYFKNQILYYNTGKNLGGAGGFAFGLEQAVNAGYDAIWMMDDDTFVEKDSLEKLVEADNRLNGNYGFLSSIAYWKDGSICNMNRQKVTLRKAIDDFECSEVPIIMATFVSFFVRRDIVLNVGLPISEFFIWADDLEYSRRISQSFSCYAVPGSKVIHYMGSNNKVGIEQDSDDRLWRYKYLYRNEVYVYRREGLKGWLYLILRVLLHSFRVLRSNQESRGIRLQTIWKSFAEGLHFHPPIKQI